MEVVQSTCPGCQRTLNIPAEWTGKTVKCKFCGLSMLIAAKYSTPVDAPLPAMAEVSAPPAAMPVPEAMPVYAPAAMAAPTWEPLPSANGLPEYTPPLAPQATTPIAVAPAPRSNYVSAFDTRDKYSGRGSYSGPKNRGWVKYAVVAVLFLGLGGGTIGLIAMKPGLFRSSPTTEPTQAGNGGQTGGGTATPVESGVFPRRMLAISVHSYLYANPLHNGDSGFAMDDARRSGTDAAIRRLAERWKVPNEQRYHLTDARLLGEGDGKPKKGENAELPKRMSKSLPLKMVIEGSMSQFLDTSRAQDRIVIVFCGHAIERKGETYLVPLEGDFDEVETLIPLKWFYEKLGACQAQEKVVIYDVCRFHPERGVERPHPGPMTESLEKALHDSPDGVTVITSCSKGEQSIELDSYTADLSYDRPGVKSNGAAIYGSFFLSMFHAASLAGVLAPDKKLSAPGDEIPVERLTSWLTAKLGEVVHYKFPERTQTLKVTLKRRTEAIAFNPAEPSPGRFEYPTPPPSVDPKAVMAIVRDIQLPPIKSFRVDAPPPSISDVLPFSQEALKDYLHGELMPGEKANEFQQAVLEAVEEMRRQRGAGSGSELPEEFGGETSDRAKDELRKIQEVPARVEAILQDYLDKLETVADQKDKQPKRWQVNYDYVLAQIKLRICYVNQYNLALANVRGGKLPDLKGDQNGFRLTAETTLDKNTPSDKKEMFNEARKALADIAKDHPKTPWALLAKSDRTVAIGLRLTASSVTGAFK